MDLRDRSNLSSLSAETQRRILRRNWIRARLSILFGARCTACGVKLSKLLFVGLSAYHLGCPRCGTSVAGPRAKTLLGANSPRDFSLDDRALDMTFGDPREVRDFVDFHRSLLRETFDSLESGAQGCVVEVGAAEGLVTGILREMFSEVIVVEPSSELFALSGRIADDGFRAPLESALYSIDAHSADAVIALSVIEHLWNPSAALRALHRVCKSRAILVTLVPTKAKLLDGTGHVSGFTIRGYWKLLERTGWRILRTRTLPDEHPGHEIVEENTLFVATRTAAAMGN
ncbi:MAG: class I SAM-dependent methyltransferase [Planctomycetes bacterium]|nr:class I SAM-dependent methyltransferase [Planctomycetota bacterium]